MIVKEEIERLYEEPKLRPTMGGEINFRVKLVPTTNPQAKQLQRNALAAISQYHDRGAGEIEFSLKRSEVEDARQRFAKAGIRMQEAGRDEDESSHAEEQSQMKREPEQEFDFDPGEDEDLDI